MNSMNADGERSLSPVGKTMNEGEPIIGPMTRSRVCSFERVFR